MNFTNILSDKDFVTLAYQIILNRMPDPDGFRHSLSGLKSGSITRSEIIRNMFFSEEYKDSINRSLPEERTNIDQINDEDFVRLLYRLILKREPDPDGFEHFVREIKNGRVPRSGIVDEIIQSSEYVGKNIPPLVISLHKSRCMWVKSLPKSESIIDLGGSSAGDKRGSLVAMGYPYSFKELFIVDLPLEKRHELYADGYKQVESFNSDRGEITYVYTSMLHLDNFADSSIGFINMGQSIEHIFEKEADYVLMECMRILKPGGFLCLDTPNGQATRLQSEAFIDPDHKIEYSHKVLSEKIRNAGFHIHEQKGLNFMQSGFENKKFDIIETSKNWGIYDDIKHCYILAYRCQKPV